MARNEIDPAHVAAVCYRLGETTGTTDFTVSPTRRGYAVTMATVADARRAEAAFDRLGYRTTRPELLGHRDRIHITGWSPRRLHERGIALREAINRLYWSRQRTAAAAIDHGPHSERDIAALYSSLRGAVERGAGVITDYPAGHAPADPECMALLRTNRDLELDAAARIAQHVGIAQEATRLFDFYRQAMPTERAHEAAITGACGAAEPPLRAEPIGVRASASASAAPGSAAVGTAGSSSLSSESGSLTVDRAAGYEVTADGTCARLDPQDPSDQVEIVPDEHPVAVAGRDEPADTGPSVTAASAAEWQPSSATRPGRTRGM